MKNIYSKIFLLSLLFILQLYFPVRLTAQCLCAGGIAATPLTYLQPVPPTQSSNTIFSFPKFDPAVGTLSCIRFEDTINVLVTTVAKNTDTTDGHDYKFLTTISADIKGPRNSGIFNWNATHADSSTNYGPLYLEKDSTPRLAGDSIAIGPDSLIKHVTGSSTPPDIAPFLGTGLVNFNMVLSGGSLATSGGTNYTAGIRSNSWGSFRLTYYYCPNALLASGLQNFSAYKNNNNIALKWDAQNAADINQYNIEYSVDGITFTDIATINGTHSATTSTYNYNYALNGSSAGYMYFRIKQTGNDGKTGYSAVQKILLTGKTGIAVTIRPNPVTTGMSIAFDHPLNGDYSVDLVNLAGQVIVSKKMNLINSNVIPVNWSSKPASGIYFTRITNTASMEQQIVRVVVQ